jgi:hypothetical protein
MTLASRQATTLSVTIAAYALATILLGWVTGKWSEAIYFLTGLILIWYTWETREVRRAMLHQAALQIRPFLGIEYGDDRKIWVHNLGKGVARDIKCQNVPLTQGQPGDTIITVEWKAIDFLLEGHKRELIGEGAFIEGGDAEREKFAERLKIWLANFGPHGKSVYEFVIDYADLTGRQYRAVVKVNRGHTELVRDAELEGN